MQFRHHAIMFKRDTSHSLREIIAVQSSKQQKLTDFLPKLSLDFSRMFSTDNLLEGHESPVLNLTSKPPPHESAEQQRLPQYGKG